jgi:hypothetical protein
MKNTIQEKPIRNLACCCCGECTRGRQWRNRDLGFGYCESCDIRHKENEEEKKEIYGIRGIHFCLIENSK